MTMDRKHPGTYLYNHFHVRFVQISEKTHFENRQFLIQLPTDIVSVILHIPDTTHTHIYIENTQTKDQPLVANTGTVFKPKATLDPYLFKPRQLREGK